MKLLYFFVTFLSLICIYTVSAEAFEWKKTNCGSNCVNLDLKYQTSIDNAKVNAVCGYNPAVYQMIYRLNSGSSTINSEWNYVANVLYIPSMYVPTLYIEGLRVAQEGFANPCDYYFGTEIALTDNGTTSYVSHDIVGATPTPTPTPTPTSTPTPTPTPTGAPTATPTPPEPYDDTTDWYSTQVNADILYPQNLCTFYPETNHHTKNGVTSLLNFHSGTTCIIYLTDFNISDSDIPDDAYITSVEFRISAQTDSTISVSYGDFEHKEAPTADNYWDILGLGTYNYANLGIGDRTYTLENSDIGNRLTEEWFWSSGGGAKGDLHALKVTFLNQNPASNDVLVDGLQYRINYSMYLEEVPLPVTVEPCGLFAFVCQVSGFIASAFADFFSIRAVNTSVIDDFVAYTDAKVPFAYINAVVSLDLSDPEVMPDTLSFDVPLAQANSYGIPTEYSFTTPDYFDDFTNTIRLGFTIVLWLVFIFYILSRIGRIL